LVEIHLQALKIQLNLYT